MGTMPFSRWPAAGSGPRDHGPGRARSRAARRAAAGLLVLLFLAGCGGETLELVGTVERRSVELAAPVSETIVEIPKALGDRVAANELVVHLDDEVARLELEAAEAASAAAEANLVAASRELERSKGLARARVNTPKELDAAQRAHDEAAARVAEQAAREAQAQRRLDELSVRSPAAGVIDQLPFETGERVPAGGVVAVVLADEAPWVRIYLPARAVSRLAPGAAASVEVEGLPKRLEGRLRDIAREPEFTPHYALTEREREHLVFEARVTIEGAPADLRPGIPATVTLRLGRAKGGP